ncbi:oncomodulin-like [Tubulanus polymorphus]|uniref:oncomodulin-like n=1 Tax=Tubulanus polymorphus TaxID=672921 RepID=UPI003DA31F10
MKYIKHLDNTYNCRENRTLLDFNDFVHDWFSEKVVKKWKDTFEEFDKDKSGDLDAEEVECYLSFLGQIGEQGEKVRATLMESDTDGNGRISSDEFEKFVKAEIKKDLEAILENFIVKIDQDWQNAVM